MSQDRFPPGWDKHRVQAVLDHYELQTDEEALAEDEAALRDRAVMTVPHELVPKIRDLIAKHKTAKTG